MLYTSELLYCREGSWWSNLLGGNKPNAAEYVHPPRQINPTAGLAEVRSHI